MPEQNKQSSEQPTQTTDLAPDPAGTPVPEEPETERGGSSAPQSTSRLNEDEVGQ